MLGAGASSVIRIKSARSVGRMHGDVQDAAWVRKGLQGCDAGWEGMQEALQVFQGVVQEVQKIWAVWRSSTGQVNEGEGWRGCMPGARGVRKCKAVISKSY